MSLGRRDSYLDDWRGIFHVTMLVDHLPLLFPGMFPLIAALYEGVGYVSVAEGFVFLSGYFTGLVYTRLRRENGDRAMWRKAALRALTIYSNYILAILLVLLLVKLGGVSCVTWGTWSHLVDEPLPVALLQVIALVWQPGFLEILPMYSLFLLFAPIIIAQLDCRRHWLIILLAVFIWTADQFGARAALMQILGTAKANIYFGYFDSFAWQILFIAGLICGHRSYQSQEPWLPRAKWLPVAACLAAILFFLGRHAIIEFPVSSRLFDRFNLGPLRLLNFACIAFLAARFRSPVEKLIRWKGLTFLSRYSLQVFAFHLIPIYVASLLIAGKAHFVWWEQLLFTGFCVSGLFYIAWLSHAIKTHFGKSDATGKTVPATAAVPSGMRKPSEATGAVAYIGILLLLMLVEWLRCVQSGNAAIQAFQSDLNGIVLSRSFQIPVIIGLVLYLFWLHWMVIRNRQMGCALPGFWKRLTVIQVCRMALVALVFVACLPGWKDGASPGNQSHLLLGIDQSTNAMVLLIGLAMSCAAEIFLEAGRKSVGTFQSIVLVSIPLFLAIASLAHSEGPHVYKYHDAMRWAGIWVNPNTYGLLMGVGLILAICHLISGLKSFSEIPRHPTISKQASCGLWIVVTFLCGFGLLKSYSRGAWIATICGMAFVLWKNVPVRFRSCLLPLTFAFVSTFVLAFWQFRYAETPLVRRVLSVGNINDFSWRNRVTVWRGSGQMLEDRPLLGFGWGQVEKAYDESYRARRLEDTRAIQLNDFFTLGTSAGVPALICFLILVGGALHFKFQRIMTSQLPGGPSMTPNLGTFSDEWLITGARAGCILLLVGFWFDGGLFRLATGPLFWTLAQISHSCVPVSPPILPPRLSLQSRALRKLWFVTGMLVILASAETAFYLLLPRLTINERTLPIARKFLVQRNEIQDFDYLIAKPIWSRKPLGSLLEHLQLAGYNRNLVAWQCDDSLYRRFVLSPEIDPAVDGEMNWRRPLWEYFYPRIRRTQDAMSASQAVVAALHAQITISDGVIAHQNIAEIWSAGITENSGWERICVAALRSVGIAAQLNSDGNCEVFTAGKWQTVK